MQIKDGVVKKSISEEEGTDLNSNSRSGQVSMREGGLEMRARFQEVGPAT